MKPLQVLPWGAHSRLALGAYQHGPKPVTLVQEAIELWRFSILFSKISAVSRPVSTAN